MLQGPDSLTGFTFSSSSCSCIGWCFAYVMELHAFMIDLLSNFEFSLDTHDIRQEACGVVAPTIEGQVEKGS
ncbi:hypothetical protein IW262DRAFT_1278893 [Armillaria fumosa]|nr:hypothetical protein IW262DRAFT_1278893 [Armillaria fumosa]